MAAVIGHEGTTLLLVAILLMLATGLAGALLAATRAGVTTIRTETTRPVSDGPLPRGRRNR